MFDVEWCNVKCAGMMWRGARCNDNVLHIPHLTTTAQYFTPNPISGTAHHTIFHVFQYHQITREMWNLVWCAMPDVGCCALFILMCLWCGIRYYVEYVRHGAMLWCAMSGVKCGDAMWNEGVVYGDCGGVPMQVVKCCGIPSDVEWFDAILDMVWCGMMVEMQCGMCCGLECVLWDSVMCNLIECDVHGVVRGGMWAWCGMVCRDVVEWFYVNCGAMWNVAISDMVWCGIWRGVDCGVLVCGTLHNARCGKIRVVKCGVELWWRMLHMQWAVIVVWCQMWWCNVMWNMVWCEMWCWMWVWCGIVVGVEWCEMWTMAV